MTRSLTIEVPYAKLPLAHRPHLNYAADATHVPAALGQTSPTVDNFALRWCPPVDLYGGGGDQPYVRLPAAARAAWGAQSIQQNRLEDQSLTQVDCIRGNVSGTTAES
ncbi:unnamed protein product [Prorocentrum cordatum]|uniref:Uncharacterized protein n=1 Tax=Prorocentrum cordatum TaxID=2364126 RepID=A0ABN9TI09_9DINO|nr:unnamed protein product [Polarella glacialis]